MVGAPAGDMIGESALSIKMGADAVDIDTTIHPHPKLGSSIGMAVARMCRRRASKPENAFQIATDSAAGVPHFVRAARLFVP